MRAANTKTPTPRANYGHPTRDELIGFIRETKTDLGRLPTLDEIVTHMKWGSASTARRALRQHRHLIGWADVRLILDNPPKKGNWAKK